MTNYDATELHKRVRFFIQHVALEPGGVETAMELARAEQTVEQGPYTFQWGPTPDPDLTFMSADMLADMRCGRLYVSTCQMWVRDVHGTSWPRLHVDNVVHLWPLDSAQCVPMKRLLEANLARLQGLGGPPLESPLDAPARIREDAVGEREEKVG